MTALNMNREKRRALNSASCGKPKHKELIVIDSWIVVKVLLLAIINVMRLEIDQRIPAYRRIE